jgi:hypothetical protein
MQEESIIFTRQLVNSIEKNLEIMKDSIKDSDKEKFAKMKKESLNLNQEIEKLLQ